MITKQLTKISYLCLIICTFLVSTSSISYGDSGFPSLPLYQTELPAIENLDGYSGKLAYSNDGLIHTLDLETGEHIRYRGVPGMGGPTWSADGQFIYFESLRLYRINLVDDQIDVLTQFDGFEVPHGPFVLDPSQQWLIYHSLAVGISPYWRLNLATVEEERFNLLASGKFDYGVVKWSGDGQTILLKKDGHLYVIAASCVETQDCEVQQVTSGNNDILNASISHDEQKVVYIRSWFDQRFTSDIYTININGTNEQQLTNTLSPIGEGDAEFSPNGEFIVYRQRNSDVNRSSNLFIMRADGSEVTQITTDGGTEPDWWMDPADLE